MSAIDDVLQQETWELSKGTGTTVFLAGSFANVVVADCPFSPVGITTSLETAQARAAVASQAPAWGQALEEVEAVTDAALELNPDDPERHEKALRMIRAVAKKALGGLREAAGD